MPRWPKGPGYSVCCWIRADSFIFPNYGGSVRRVRVRDSDGSPEKSSYAYRGGANNGARTTTSFVGEDYSDGGRAADAGESASIQRSKHIFSFVDKRDRGVELFLIPSSRDSAKGGDGARRRSSYHKRKHSASANLVLRVAQNDRSVAIVKDTGITLREQRWYFITLCHWRHSGVAQVYVDGVPRWRENRIPYPNCTTMPYCCIGCSADSRVWSDERLLRQTCLHGRMGVFAVFAEPLNEVIFFISTIRNIFLFTKIFFFFFTMSAGHCVEHV